MDMHILYDGRNDDVHAQISGLILEILKIRRLHLKRASTPIDSYLTPNWPTKTNATLDSNVPPSITNTFLRIPMLKIMIPFQWPWTIQTLCASRPCNRIFKGLRITTKLSLYSGSVSCANSASKVQTNIAIVNVNCINARLSFSLSKWESYRLPMQIRGPKPKGIHAAGLQVSSSFSPGIQRVGMNLSGLEK